VFELIVHHITRKLGEDGDSDAGGGDSGEFAGSMLDWSVNYGHGTAGDAEAAREIAGIQEKAELLDDDERYRH
jgi:hypothetical protein